MAELPAPRGAGQAGSGTDRQRPAGCHTLCRTGTSGAGQPLCRAPGTAPQRARRRLAEHRLLALAMSRPLDLGSDKATQPMARLITPALLGLLLATFLLSLAVGSTSVAVLPGLYGFLTGEVGLDEIGRAHV